MQIGETVMFLDHENMEREGVIESINEITAQIGSSKALYIIPISSILWSITEIEQEMLNSYHDSLILEAREIANNSNKSNIEKSSLIKEIINKLPLLELQ
tara:strand:- start:7021 stop:7320 length:300 start_codon:yes stop_codon:yes gene_type:complete